MIINCREAKLGQSLGEMPLSLIDQPGQGAGWSRGAPYRFLINFMVYQHDLLSPNKCLDMVIKGPENESC